MDYRFRYVFEHTIDHDEITRHWTLIQIEEVGGAVQKEIQNLKDSGYVINERVLIDLL